MSQRLRNFCFTINNWTEEDWELITSIDYSYLIIGKEKGDNGTPHLQGYCELTNQTRWNTVKDKYLPRAHIEKRKGSALEASGYCKKENNFVEFGTISRPGTRKDIKAAYEEARKGTTLKNFLELHEPNYQSIKVFEIARQVLQEPRNFKPYVEWLYGPTGTGKTRYVVEKETDLWISGKNLKWWQGYENQEATLFDDFRKDFCTFHELLRILDRYPYTVEIKGGSKQLNSKRMYITSCYSPDEIYDTREDLKQLLRRIDNVTCLKSDVSEVGGNTKPPTSCLLP